MRSLLRKVRPVLQRKGWSRQDLDEIGLTVKAAIDGRDAEQFAALRAWMEQVVMELFDGVAVKPVLPYEAEVRLLDCAWKRIGGGRT